MLTFSGNQLAHQKQLASKGGYGTRAQPTMRNIARGSASRWSSVMVVAYRDAAGLRQIQEAKMRQTMQRYQEASKNFPKVRFIVAGPSDLGESWKVCGASPEMGRWAPQVAPVLTWREGGKWQAEVALPPGNHTFKAVLRKANGQYIWEAAQDRVVQVPQGSGGKIIEVNLKVSTEAQVKAPVRELVGAY